MKPRLNMKSYTTTRTAKGTPVNGRYSPGSQTTITVRANVQPYGGSQETLPEGRHVETTLKLFTATKLFTVDEPGFEPDQLSVDGEAYEVFNVDGWPGHYEVLIARQVRP